MSALLLHLQEVFEMNESEFLEYLLNTVIVNEALKDIKDLEEENREICIYISGDIENDLEYREKFEEVENDLSLIFPKAKILNPAKIENLEKLKTIELLGESLKLLENADILFRLSDWENSICSQMELEYANKEDLIILPEEII